MAVDLKSSGAEALPQIPGSVDVDATAAGTEAERLGTAIENTQVAKNKDAVPEEWTGAAADAASAEIQALGVKVKTLSEAFPTAGKALKDWDYQLRGIRGKISLLQAAWDYYLSEYNSAVADAGQQEVNDPTIDKESLISKARSTLSTHQETLRGKYDGHISFLNETAQSTANTIDEARRNIVSDEAGSRGRSGVGAALFGSDTPILSGAAQWAHAQEIAPEIADALKKEPLTLADVNAFNNKYGKYLQNPFYATALAQHLSIDDINKAAIAALGTGYDKNGMRVSNTYEEFNRNLGTLMVLSTGGSNLSEANIDNQRAFDLVSDALVGKDKANVRQIVQSSLDDLKAYGRTEYSRPSLTGGMSRVLYGYEIFGQLAGAAAYENDSLALGPEFYAGYEGRGDSVFTDMVNWDHEINNHDYARNMEMTPRDYMLCGGEKGKGGRPDGFFDALQSVFALSDTPDNLENLSEEDQLLFRQHEDVRLEALRGALANDTSFGVPEANSKPMSMVRYLTAYRGDADSGGSAFFDGGDVFGKTIFDATTPASSMIQPLAEDYAGGEESLEFKKANRAYEAWKTDAENRASIVGNLIAGT